jgi:hypothetical protein
LRRRLQPFDDKIKRHTLRFGDCEASLTDADVAQLHDTLVRLHGYPDPTALQLCARLRQALEEAAEVEPMLELDAAAARKVQLAVFSDQRGRKRVSPALAEARLQAFAYLEADSGAG